MTSFLVALPSTKLGQLFTRPAIITETVASVKPAIPDNLREQMSRGRRSFIIALILLALSGVYFGVAISRPFCNSPLVLNPEDRAKAIVEGLVERKRKSPEENINSSIVAFSSTDEIDVVNWQIENVTTSNVHDSLWQNLIDDDSIYQYSIDFRATDSLSNEVRWRWSSWRYGLVVCPFVFSRGDGPLGEISLID